MKKGFTLIELLAIIVLLGIISTIVRISINKTIENSKKQTAIINAEKLIKAVNTYKTSYELQYGRELVNTTISINDGKISNIDLQIDGKLPLKGEITIDNEGNVYIYTYENEYCVVKDSEKLEANKSNKEDCNYNFKN